MEPPNQQLQTLREIKNKSGEVKLSDVYNVTANNYILSLQWKLQLQLLQEWVLESKKNSENK